MFIHFKIAPKNCKKCGEILAAHTELEGTYRASFTVKWRFCDNKRCKAYNKKLLR